MFSECIEYIAYSLLPEGPPFLSFTTTTEHDARTEGPEFEGGWP